MSMVRHIRKRIRDDALYRQALRHGVGGDEFIESPALFAAAADGVMSTMGREKGWKPASISRACFHAVEGTVTVLRRAYGAGLVDRYIRRPSSDEEDELRAEELERIEKLCGGRKAWSPTDSLWAYRKRKTPLHSREALRRQGYSALHHRWPSSPNERPPALGGWAGAAPLFHEKNHVRGLPGEVVSVSMGHGGSSGRHYDDCFERPTFEPAPVEWEIEL